MQSSNVALAQELAEPVGVVGFVGDETAIGRNHVEQSACGTKVVRLAGGQDQPTGRPRPSTMALILVVNPSRERPTA